MPIKQSRLVHQLRSADAYPHATEEICAIQTHISWVFLTGQFAYKIKKAVKLPFLDFSTLELRETFCRAELELNRRLAPEIYLDVVPIGGSAEKPRIGTTPAIEFAVKMLQFPADATADQLLAADGLSLSELTGLAERIAAFHQSLPSASGEFDGSRILKNLSELESMVRDDADSKVASLVKAIKTRVTCLTDELRARVALGAIRECHGDLHLGNVARVNDELIAFDCLEFDPLLRTIDVIDEVAFLYMDLIAHERPDLAFAYINRYLAETGDYAALRLLRFYAAHRACVRAKVAAIAQDSSTPVVATGQTLDYLATAWRQIEASSAPLMLTCGLSGSGKSTVASRLVTRLGALQVRSDVERKRLHGLAPTTRSDSGIDSGIYGPAATTATYQQLLGAAKAALTGGVPMIIDAAFIAREQRDQFRELAAAHSAPFLVLYCQAPEIVLRQRIRDRSEQRSDPSDASVAVLERQLEKGELPDQDEMAHTLIIDTAGPLNIDRIASEIAQRTQPSLSSTSY